MTYIFGSARISENGNAGWDGKAQAGDQTGKEVSTQNFYVSSKGWWIFRWKNAAYATRAAQLMQQACDNANIGYDQSQRSTLLSYIKEHGCKNISEVKSAVECDCSALVRVIIYMTSGKDPGDLYTACEPEQLTDCGLFQDKIGYESGTKLYTGDILVTKSTGHTGIIVSGESRTTTTTTTSTSSEGFDMSKLPLIKRGSYGNSVKAAQLLLIGYGYSCGSCGADKDFGPSTENATVAFQKAKGLTADGEIGPKTWAALLGC